MSSELLVPIDQPAAPYILASAGFLATLAKVEAEVATLDVTSPEQAQNAAQLQIRLTNAGKELERVRVELTAPFLAAQRKIAEVAREPQNRIEEAKNRIKGQLIAWDDQQRRAAAKAEADRQAELKRLQEKLAAEQAEERKRQAQQAEEMRAAAAKSKAVVEDFDDDTPAPPIPKTETEKAIEAVVHAPVVAQAKPVGISMKVILAVAEIDVAKLPDVFVERMAKLKAIQSTFCHGWKEGDAMPVCAGVTFEVKRTPVATGR